MELATFIKWVMWILIFGLATIGIFNLLGAGILE
jgi:hypothetical protein